MLSKDTLNFLSDLKQNNNRNWFQQNRHRYELMKTEYLGLAEELLSKMKTIDPALINVTPKDCVFRIYRDVRFSPNKMPYKTHLGIVLSSDRKMSERAGYYIHIEDSESFLAGGMHYPSSDILKKVRHEISNFYDEFLEIINNIEFKTRFKDLYSDSRILLKRPPQGFSADNKAIEYLKLKSFEVLRKFDISNITNKKGIDFIVDNLTHIKSLNDFLNRTFD